MIQKEVSQASYASFQQKHFHAQMLLFKQFLFFKWLYFGWKEINNGEK